MFNDRNWKIGVRQEWQGFERRGELPFIFDNYIEGRDFFEVKSKVNLNYIGGRVKGAENLSEKLI